MRKEKGKKEQKTGSEGTRGKGGAPAPRGAFLFRATHSLPKKMTAKIAKNIQYCLWRKSIIV